MIIIIVSFIVYEKYNDYYAPFFCLDIKKWQDYTEPGDELDPGSPLRRTSRNLDDDTAESLPLPEGVLTTNLGLDVVVVITKTDYMSTLEKEQDYK